MLQISFKKKLDIILQSSRTKKPTPPPLLLFLFFTINGWYPVMDYISLGSLSVSHVSHAAIAAGLFSRVSS